MRKASTPVGAVVRNAHAMMVETERGIRVVSVLGVEEAAAVEDMCRVDDRSSRVSVLESNPVVFLCSS
jgi:hypothetical protein